MNELFDCAAPKENITLELDAALLQQAKDYGINLDEAVESALIEAIERHTNEPETGRSHV